MSNRKTREQSQSGRSRAYERLTPESAVLLLVDHQSGLVSGIRDLAPDEVHRNVVGSPAPRGSSTSRSCSPRLRP
jgi:hypothetical protein